MVSTKSRTRLASLAEIARPFDNAVAELAELAGDARFVLIGEASHGTHEFYETRAEITRRLIEENGFTMVALEADWPDTLRVHRYVNGDDADGSASEALADFRRFPTWMWRNTVMVEFIDWLRTHNEAAATSCGIFGMDLYSMHASIEAVLGYLDQTDPEAAERARRRYGCFEEFGKDPQAYGYATTMGGEEPCEDEVVAQLTELRRNYGDGIGRDEDLSDDERFYTEQNARLVANAERYYRSMFQGRDASWNLRDQHMAETLNELMSHFNGDRGKIVVWAHNSHLGDARATAMGQRGEWNVGQLMREGHGKDVFSIGFTTYQGEVTAARDWGALAERRLVRRALKGSYEDLLHDVGIERFWLDLRQPDAAIKDLRQPRLERAIGVIYRPETERWSHFFESCLPDQFDALIHLDRTSALKPLEPTSEWDRGELPETFPHGV